MDKPFFDHLFWSTVYNRGSAYGNIVCNIWSTDVTVFR